MAEAIERVNAPISSRELERRWTAIRAAMAESRIDVLLAQASNDFMGGYVKYLTDIPATNGYPVTVVFPADDRMTVVGQGPVGQVRQFPPEGDGVRRGVKQFLGTPSYASARYTAEYDGELAASALERYAGATVGLLGTGAISFALVDHLRRRFPAAKLADASELVDRVKALKSAEEIALLRRTAAMQDAAMEAAFAAIRPGMRDLEVAAVAEEVGHRHGSEQGLFLCASAPVGTPAAFGNRHFQNRVIREGDYFTLLVENSGPGGLYTELGRTCVLGRAPQEMKDELAFVLEAQRFTVERLAPGASCPDLWRAYNDFMRRNGRPEEKRLHCHGQGYDMVEPPLVRFDETMPIGENMVLACHPAWATERTYAFACDTFLVQGQGAAERLHRFPQKVVELG